MPNATTGGLSRLLMAAIAGLLAFNGLQQIGEGWRLEPTASQNGWAWAAYSQAMLDHANAQKDPTAIAAATANAQAAAETALRLAPAQPGTWARLALLRANQGNIAGALQALDRSFRTGPEIIALASLSSRLGLYLWEDMQPGMKARLAADLRHLWRQPASAKLPYSQVALVRFTHGIRRLDAVRKALPQGEHALLNERIISVLKETAGAS